MLDIKTIIIYLFISSIAYRFLLFPKKILTLRGGQLILIFLYDILLVFNIIENSSITFSISTILYFMFIFYPQMEYKKILGMIIKADGNNEKNIKQRLKILFILTADFEAFKYSHGVIEYFLKTIAQNTEKIKVKPNKMNSFVKRSTPHITYSLMIIIITMFLITNNDDLVKVQFNLIKYGGNFYELVNNGEYFRFFSSIFLHANWMHLLMNGFALFYLGLFIERVAKTRSFYLSIFVVGGVIASISSYLLAKQNSVGASGAIFALIGALFSIIWLSKDEIGEEFRKKILRDVLFIIVINISIGLSIKNIDNYAHMGGLISGAIITYVLYKVNNKFLFKLFDLVAISIIIYGSFFLYKNIKMSYPETINFKKDITISNVKFVIPYNWSRVIKNNNSLYQDLFSTRFILENINGYTYNSAELLSKDILKREFNGKSIVGFKNINIKINNHSVKLIKFRIEFNKKGSDIRVARIYYFKYKNKYFRFTVVFFKESYDEYGDIMTRFLEYNFKSDKNF